MNWTKYRNRLVFDYLLFLFFVGAWLISLIFMVWTAPFSIFLVGVFWWLELIALTYYWDAIR